MVSSLSLSFTLFFSLFFFSISSSFFGLLICH
jgi:hypothetical protein